MPQLNLLTASRTGRRQAVAPATGFLAPLSDFNAWHLHTQNNAVAERVMDGNAVKITVTANAYNNSVQLRNDEGVFANGQNLVFSVLAWASEPLTLYLASNAAPPTYASLAAALDTSVALTTVPQQITIPFTVQNYVPGAGQAYFLPSIQFGNVPVGASLWFEHLTVTT